MTLVTYGAIACSTQQEVFWLQVPALLRDGGIENSNRKQVLPVNDVSVMAPLQCLYYHSHLLLVRGPAKGPKVG